MLSQGQDEDDVMEMEHDDYEYMVSDVDSEEFDEESDDYQE
jgi:hypothetical protein